MADNLAWLTLTAFPGIDETSDDSLIQPRRREGPVLLRRALGMETYSRRGLPVPDSTYALYDSTAATQGLHGHISGSAFNVYKALAGVIYRQTGATWASVWNLAHVPAIAPMSTTNRVRFCSAFGAIFAVDGVSRPRVIGWNYVSADPGQKTFQPPGGAVGVDTVSFLDIPNMVCEVLNTKGGLGLDFAPTHVTTHLGRLVLIKGYEVRMSAAYLPCTFYDPNDSTVANGWFLVEEGNGENITGAMSYEGKMLIVGKGHSLHAYMGTDPSLSYNHIVIDAQKGLFAADSLANGAGRIWGCSEEGPWWFATGEGLEDKWNAPIRSVWDSMSLEEKAQVVGWFEDGRYHLVLPRTHLNAPGTIPANAYARYSYDPQMKVWSHGWSVLGPTALMAPATGDEFALTAASSRIWQQRSGMTLTAADGTTQHTVTHTLETPWYNFGDAERYKWFRRMKLRMLAGPATLTLEYGLNYSEGWQTMTLTAPSPTRKWGSGKWGEGKWVGPGVIEIDLPFNLHATAFRFRLSAPGLKPKALSLGFDYEVV